RFPGAAPPPHPLAPTALPDATPPPRDAPAHAHRILVGGAGKAGAAMTVAVEDALAGLLYRVHGSVNVPATPGPVTRRVTLHPARPAGTNQPTAEGVAGTRRILELAAGANPDDLALCRLPAR